jgi:Zn-dependent oligopeptidase
MLDQNWHQLAPARCRPPTGVMAFEAAALKKDGVDFAPVPPRYRTPYFSHIMGGYSAGYYAYIWSEVLDADTVEWIKQNGGLTRANGDHFRDTLLSRGGSKDALQLFKDFAGRALLKRPAWTSKKPTEPLLSKRRSAWRCRRESGSGLDPHRLVVAAAATRGMPRNVHSGL